MTRCFFCDFDGITTTLDAHIVCRKWRDVFETKHHGLYFCKKKQYVNTI